MIERLKASLSELSRFDWIALGVALALLGAILAVILLGDHVGVRVLRLTPQGEAHTTSWITLQFSEDMARDSIGDSLRLEPPVAGTIDWSGSTLIFRPAEALTPGETYTVILEPGAASLSGRTVQHAQRFSFSVRRPQVAYLAPANTAPQNIWIADGPDHARQLTFSEAGVFNFDASPDGARIAYADYNPETDGTDLKLIDSGGGEPRLLLACPDADCTTPTWSPDGTRIAYERITHNTELNLGSSPTRVWLLSLSESGGGTVTSDRPLFSDTQIISSGPVWSPDGSRIAVYDSQAGGILITALASEDLLFIPTRQGSVGAFSPDGAWMVYPDLILAGGGTHTRLSLANLDTRLIEPLYDEAQPFDDERAVWSADGQTLIVARRYQDERYTPGRQLYRVAATTGDSKALLVDPAYYHGFFELDPSGSQIVLQRFRQPGSSAAGNPSEPEIWVYNTGDETLTPIATNAFLPQWVP